MDHFDLCIIGAGVVGLAIAEQFAAAMPSSFAILLVEQHGNFGQETSSRNSEVIHAGIYYAPGSLKAALCTRGRELLYDYCERHAVAHRRLGKLIVAQADEKDALEALFQKGLANGVTSLQWLSATQMHAKEPLVTGHCALFSPDSGIVDSHGLMQSLLHGAERAGVTFAPLTRIVDIEVSPHRFLVRAECGPAHNAEPYVFSASRVVNAAGLHATTLAARMHGLEPGTVPEMQVSKGNYFRYMAPSPFRHLIYPMPEKAQRGLGIHATLDLAGQVKFGPDVELGSALDYRVDPERRALFRTAIQRYFPSVREDALVPDYAGLRPRLATLPGMSSDFVIQDSSVHHVPGLVQLYGIESPGLTASMAIAEYVRSRTDIH